MYNENELAETRQSQNPIIDAMASVGRKGDTMMAHVTPGDYVIPKDILVQHPEFLVKLKKIMEDMGEDYRTHMVGSGFENMNPETNSPEFGFLGSVGRGIQRVTSRLPGGKTTAGQILYPAALGALAGGGGMILGTAGGMSAGAALASGGALGGLAGMQAAKSSLQQQARRDVARANNAAQSQASQQVAPMNLPSSMQELGGLTDQQRRSYLAAQGSQGSGLGGSSKDYYVNLLQRNIQSGQGGLLPVESQYLNSLGVNTGLSGQDLVNALRGV